MKIRLDNLLKVYIIMFNYFIIKMIYIKVKEVYDVKTIKTNDASGNE